MPDTKHTTPPRRKFRAVTLCLLIPYIGLLWVPFYDRAEPSLAGIPFFYWYQMAWIVLGSLSILPVWLSERGT
jgi:hypothetical protein